MFFLSVLTGVSAFSVIIYLIRNKFKIQRSIIYLPIFLYSFLIILSSLLSEYKETSIFGFANRYEGMIALCSYILLLLLTINVTRTEKVIKILITALLFSSLVIALIGIFQLFGKDIFSTEFGSSLIIPVQYKSLFGKLQFNLGDNVIYGTLYHYNYVGSFCAIVLPVSLTFFFGSLTSFLLFLPFVSLTSFFFAILTSSNY